MPKYVSVALLAALSSTALLAISQQQQTVPNIKRVPIPHTSANSGQQMYSTYCAVCHGADGKGMGPAAPALKTPPPDLTMLTKNNGGKFPADHIASVLRFGTEEPAHGTAEMPIWGDLLHSLHPDDGKGGVLVQQRIKNITDYIRQIQQ